MKKLKDIINELNYIKMYNGEILYSFSNLYSFLYDMKDEFIEVEDCILLPNYIYDNKRFEPYWLELKICLVDKLDFEKYILKRTEYLNFEDISKDIIDFHKNLYIEALKDKNMIPKEKLNKYIQYLFNIQEIREYAKKIFNEFDKENLYFLYY